ncbi:3-phenylpropionate-dihydrodiol/cinnamic acid-dihydrodiol dehydrogenase [Nocardioides sp. T2.26MG-1]|nr:3-phenylpropionate-dihydrodiol/cinnamic acid-dihydrodiol dehydrogenase [Nocardioides sp. T2.26MG-1]
MQVALVIGAGPGVGASVADRFAREGYAVGLVARDEARLGRAADDLATRTGARTATSTADATDPDQVRRAVDSVAAELGPPSVLCFSPIPDVGLIKPVLETRAEELIASLRLNVAGAAAAVESALPAMLAAGHGSLLFTTGSAALTPDPARAASAVTTTAATTYVALLRQALDGTGVRVGHTVIVGPIDRDRDDAHHPDDVAADLWAHHRGDAGRFASVLRLPPPG